MGENYYIISSNPWDQENTEKLSKLLPGNFFFEKNMDDLFMEEFEMIIPETVPDKIFFVHYSKTIPKWIYENYECIVFHMTNLPFGRGGSPLQNLINLGIKNTMISAIRAIEEIDAGDIYLKRSFYIGDGNADSILRRASDIIFFDMIPDIIKGKYNLVKQNNESKAMTFKRRAPKQSDLNSAILINIDEFYDFIRMLDGVHYPPAFLNFGDYHIEFKHACMEGDEVIGDFRIKKSIGSGSSS